MADFQGKNSPSLKVYYFNIAGKGEPIRLACEYGKLNWEDVRVSGNEFAAMKDSKKLDFGQLPALEVDDSTMLFQSGAIMRFVGKLAGLYPTNDDIKAAKIDALVDQEADIFAPLSMTKYKERMGFGFMTEEHVALARKALNDEVLPRQLSQLEAILERSPSGWLAGDATPSIADFIFAIRLKSLVAPGTYDGISTNMFDKYPRIAALIDNFYKLPAVVKYYADKEGK